MGVANQQLIRHDPLTSPIGLPDHLSFDLSGWRYRRINPVVLRPTEPFLRGKPLSCAFLCLVRQLRVEPDRRVRGTRKPRSGFFNSFSKDHYATAESPHPPPGIRSSLKLRRTPRFRRYPSRFDSSPPSNDGRLPSPPDPILPSVPPKVPRPIRVVPSALRLGLLCLQRVVPCPTRPTCPTRPILKDEQVPAKHTPLTLPIVLGIFSLHVTYDFR